MCMRSGVKCLVLSAAVLVAGATGAQAASVELKLSTLATPGSIWAEMIEGYIDRVDELSAGEIKITPFWSAQLGNQEDTLNMMLRGRLDIWLGPMSSFSMLANETTVFGLPYLFKDYREASCVVEAMTPPTAELVKDRGHFLGFYPNGWMGLASDRPVHSPKDLEGMKVRVGAQKTSVEFWRAAGGEPVSIPVSELSQALSTKLVHGADNVVPYYNAMSHYTQAPYYTLTNHSLNVGAAVISKQRWSRLSDEQRQIMTQAQDAIAFTDTQEMFRIAEDALINSLEQKGVTFLRLSEDERKAWEHVGHSIHQKIQGSLRGDVEPYVAMLRAAKDSCVL